MPLVLRVGPLQMPLQMPIELHQRHRRLVLRMGCLQMLLVLRMGCL
jgi:hypothetical protein